VLMKVMFVRHLSFMLALPGVIWGLSLIETGFNPAEGRFLLVWTLVLACVAILSNSVVTSHASFWALIVVVAAIVGWTTVVFVDLPDVAVIAQPMILINCWLCSSQRRSRRLRIIALTIASLLACGMMIIVLASFGMRNQWPSMSKYSR
jgi:hypothetical protein